MGRANESEAGIRAVMDSVANAIVTFDQDGNIISCNRAAERLFGYSGAELVQHSIGHLVPEAAQQQTATTWFDRIWTADSIVNAVHECEGRHQDGTSMLLEVSISETRQEGDRRLIVVARDIAERKQAEKVLRHQALHDELTGLPNRTLLDDRLRQAILTARRENKPLALLLVDLDRFKEINDTFGHHHGDLLLQQVGPRLAAMVRASDTVARLGGDEFALLLPGADAEGAVRIAHHLLTKLEEPFQFNGQSFEIGASVGIAGYPAHGADAATLLRQADVAMYVAKRGDNRVAVYTVEQDHNSAERLALGGELRRALETGELRLHFQPKLDLRDGTLAGVEALVRWQHPQRGLLPPLEFISLAEETGLIYPLTRWVLDAALQQQQVWRAMDLEIPVAVNLSRRTIHDPQLPEMVAQLLKRWDAAPAGLLLELTESSLMTDPLRAAENLAQLQALGVRMSIDDFGTGYSSLASLKNLPVDELKIDQSFVQAMATDPSARAIVRSIIDLADALKLRVVAEGVEDRATWDVLASLGCDMAQGYFLSRPIAAAELEAWLAQVGPSWLEIAARPNVEDPLQERIRERGARLIAEEEFLARKQAEAALGATEERSRRALQAAGMGTWAWDVINDKHTWSSETEILSGLAPGEFDGSFETVTRVIHPDDWPAFELEERASLAERRDSLTTYRVVWPDGSIRWLESNGRALYAADGTLQNITGTSLDITERKLAEQALRANEERFRKQYMSFPLPTYSWLQEGDEFIMEDYNDAAEAAAVEDLSSLIGVRASERYADQPQLVADLHACVRQQQTVRREMRFPAGGSGRERQLALTCVFVPPSTVMVHSEDVTEARQAEQQREAMAQSEKLRALGQMASGIAHDLNQSLMLVASYSDLALEALVQDPPDLAEVEDLLTTTSQAALDGGETVKRLLLFTRAAPDRDLQAVDLASIVREAAHLTAPRWRDAAQVEGRPISLHVEAEGHPTILGSPAQLRELMTNVIFNAVDALPHGGTIRLRAAAEHGQGIIEIVDSGVGMSTEVQERVFEPFFTTKGEGGTGLGLAMVFRIVEQHGGRIEVRSAPGAGTTFRITLPLASEAAGAVAGLSPTLPDSAEPQGPLRILAVDDEPMMTRAVARMLRSSGHVVSMAASGEEALVMLGAQSYEVVLSDMGMGAGMNGWELAEAVKRRWPEVRFLLATGWGAAIDPEEARSRGVEAVLAKPYQVAQLLRVLESNERVAHVA